MLGPTEIRHKCRMLWDSGRVLRAWLGVDDLFPLSFPLGPPRGGPLLEEFAALGEWKTAVESGCKCAGGAGYCIEYQELEHRRLGRWRLPQWVVFDTPLDLIGYLGESPALGEFVRLSREIRYRFPPLREWIEARPMQVLEQAPHWPRLLAVVEWFLAHPRPHLYLGELAIPGVDTEFLAGHKKLLWELLDRLLPEEAVDREVTGLARHGFERRFGLRYE